MRGHVGQRERSWFFVADVGRDERGRRKQHWRSGFKTRREAEKAMREFLATIDRGTYVEPTKQTMAVYLRAWVDAIDVRPTTRDSYRMNIETRIIPRIGSTLVQKVTPALLDALYRELETKGGRRHKGLSPRSVRYAHTILHKAFADATRKGALAQNPAARSDPPRQRRPIVEAWTIEELRRFLATAANERLYAMWLLASTTGMRRGEVLGLRWSDLSLDAARASVQQTVVLVRSKPVISTPKTERGRRLIALDPATVAALRTHRARQAEERLALGLGWDESGLVFTQVDGGVINPERVSRWFRQLVRRSGVRQIRLHSLRHTHASLALQAGIHPKVVSERLGHQTVSFTLDVYSHAIPALQEDAATRVAAMILDG